MQAQQCNCAHNKSPLRKATIFCAVLDTCNFQYIDSSLLQLIQNFKNMSSFGCSIIVFWESHWEFKNATLEMKCCLLYSGTFNTMEHYINIYIYLYIYIYTHTQTNNFAMLLSDIAVRLWYKNVGEK